MSLKFVLGKDAQETDHLPVSQVVWQIKGVFIEQCHGMCIAGGLLKGSQRFCFPEQII